MKVSQIISSSRRSFVSLEIVPPQKGVSKQELLEGIRPLMEFGPEFINVTCHRDQIEYVQEKDGSFSRHIVRKKVSETAVCAAIQAEFGVEVVPHVICAGASAEMISNQLNDFKFLGIENVMALRGDCLIGEKRFSPEPGGFRYASELVEAIGIFSREQNYSFCTGVGAYPEKHFEAPNMDEDIANLKKKVDMGADYIITQMFFDNEVFYSFRDKCREAGIIVPIVPGLKPLSTSRQLDLLPEAFSLDIPQDLVKEIRACSLSKEMCYEAGLEWCLAQCRDLLKHDVPGIHFYTMGNSRNVHEILSKIV